MSQQWTTVPLAVHASTDAQRFVREVDARRLGDRTEWGFAVEVDGRYAGTVELRDEGERPGRDRLRLAPVGAGHRRDGARAAGCCSTGASPTQGVRTVVWRAHVGNWASRRLAWRLGFSLRRHAARVRCPSAASCVDAWVGHPARRPTTGPRGRLAGGPVLEADGLRLRPWRDRRRPPDRRGVLRRAHPAVARPDADPVQRGRRARLARAPARERGRPGDGVAWAVVDRRRRRALASVNLFDLEAGRRGRGRLLGAPGRPRARGDDPGRAPASSDYAFEDLGVRRVTAAAAVDNAASRHVLEAERLRAWGTERLGTDVRGGRADLRVVRRAGRGVAGVASPTEPRAATGFRARSAARLAQWHKARGEGEGEPAARDLVAAYAADADVVRARRWAWRSI